MKKLLNILFVLTLIYGCDSEDAGNCFQSAGTITQKEISVASFEKILIYERVELILKEGPTQKIIVESGKNLISDVVVEVINNQLIVTDNNTCNFVRDYDLTKVYVTSPNITEIRNSSERPVRSDGVLTYPSLKLLAEDYLSDYLNAGDFYIEVNNTTLVIVANGISNYYISGSTTNFNITFAAGDSRLEAQNMIAQNIKIQHKSSNDMLVNPQEKITGDIYSLGDVIAFNKPAVVEVTEHYKGKLIFE